MSVYRRMNTTAKRGKNTFRMVLVRCGSDVFMGCVLVGSRVDKAYASDWWPAARKGVWIGVQF